MDATLADTGPSFRESAGWLRALLEAMQDVLIVVGPDGRYLDVATTRPDLLYRPPAEVLGKTAYDLFPREQADFFHHACQRTLQTGEVMAIEYALPLPDGEHWFEGRLAPILGEDGRPVAVLLMARDTTERKKAERTLQESEERYRLLIDLLPDGVAVHQDGVIRMVNQAGVRLLGYDKPEEVVGRPMLEFVHPDDRAIVLERVRVQVEQAQQVLPLEERFLRHDGTVLPVEVTAGPFTLGGKPAVLVVVRDISARKRLEEQLRQAQKMEAIGRLAGGIAHDFNNLLTAINGYAELLLARLRPSDPLRSDVESILKAGQRAAMLTQQLLAFSRRQVLEMRVVDLNQVLEDMTAMLRRIIGEDIALEFIPDPQLGHVRVDPGQMSQVVVNLAVNAREAMPGSGRLTIETANVELDEAYAAGRTEVTPGRYVLLSVSDTGAGMTAEARQHLFEPFFTTKEGGTGLGLATAYGIVKQFGGHIAVYSEEGHGTTFKLYLPRVEEPVEPHEERSAGPGCPGGSETILVVEDNEMVRRLALRVLREQGYTVLESSSGEEALEQAAVHTGPLHLLLTDVVMPQMSGKELLERLQEARPDLRVLYMSGYTDNVIARHGILDPGTPFIQKPFAPQTLAQKVRAVLDR